MIMKVYTNIRVYLLYINEEVKTYNVLGCKKEKEEATP